MFVHVFGKHRYFTPCALFESPVCTLWHTIVLEVVNNIAENIVNQYVNIPKQITYFQELFRSVHFTPCLPHF